MFAPTRLAGFQIQQALVVVSDAVGAAHVEEDLGAVRVAPRLMVG